MSSSSSYRVLLLICGGVAAFKSLILIRSLHKMGVDVRCVMTRSACEFITPLSVASLSGEKVYTDLFSLTDESEMGHIELSRQADVIIVAPATANIIAKMANGIADDLASTVLLATNKPVVVIPSMNVRMWEHPATQRNIQQLLCDGVFVLGPEQGDMACGEFGYGRMVEPDAIVTWMERYRQVSSPIVLIIGSIPYQHSNGTYSVPTLVDIDISSLWMQVCTAGIPIEIWLGASVRAISIPHRRITHQEQIMSWLVQNPNRIVCSIAEWSESVPNGIDDLRGKENLIALLRSKWSEQI